MDVMPTLQTLRKEQTRFEDLDLTNRDGACASCAVWESCVVSKNLQ